MRLLSFRPPRTAAQARNSRQRRKFRPFSRRRWIPPELPRMRGRGRRFAEACAPFL